MSDIFVARWAKIKAGEIVRRSSILPAFDDDFPRMEDGPAITAENAQACGWVEIANAEPPTFNSATQVIRDAAIVSLVDGVPTADWGLRDLTNEEQQDLNMRALSRLRAERNRRLTLSDWTQLPDNALTGDQRAAWAAYRQALRDLPETADVLNPNWPESP